MEEFGRKDREFLDGVWKKARYMEYLKEEGEAVKENKRRLGYERLKLGAASLIGALMVIIPVLLIGEFSMAAVLAAGLVLLGIGIFYEHYDDLQIYRRVHNENRD